ncbi:LOW QUALITY PROTEIN: hepatoma-derived growth factor-related protein 2 [Drosophila sulfurigaster albostrigata]|uniref:LOW QUALITY PROTEIN: hepatoma-derived growth factor-related protein 2 n=1 Tax=Drosophila sulfurigaster albostrigata TaxID=89887 RepID=UPI002D21C772|nr:LOW QUALITY PROTEIN: hepatoma-derived growth factor-related protein 2 [Drosophila sulfurigaster albostrigata]
MDLFDMVRAAPPPKNIRERSTAAKDTDEDSRGITSDEPLDTALDDDDSEDAAIRQAVASVQIKMDESENDETEKPDSDLLDADADGDADEVEMEVDNDGELLQPLPPKTKAQQKMFADVQPPTKRKRSRTEAATKSTPTVSSGLPLKQCVVRIKRLTHDEIEAHRPMTTTTPSPPKRGRPRKRRADETTTSQQQQQQQQKHSVSPPKKSRLSSSKVHIKLRPNGGDKHSELTKFTRAQTPPARTPSKSPSKVATTTTTKTRRRPNVPGFVSKKTIKRYGKRFFNCVVIVKRLKHSPNIQSNINAATSSGNKSNKRKSKSNLSVSFSEAVEIFGMSPRKSSSASSTRTVPTRLQRVDATGNVVEDIELPRLSAASATTATTTPTQCDSATKRSRATSGSSCNGRGGKRSGKSKRSLRVPVSGLASLSIEDSQDANADDEYIVPNELPEHPTKSGVRRSGTPNPTVKRVTTTTTISDEDDDDDDDADAVEPEPATKSSRDVRLAKRASDVKPPTEHPKPAAKRSRDKASEPLAETTAKSLAVETDEEEPEAGTAAATSVKKRNVRRRKCCCGKESAEEEAAAIETAIDAVEQELEKLQWELDGETTKVAVANKDEEDKAADEVKADDAKLLTKDMKEDEEELLEQPLQLHSDEDDEAKPELPTVKSDDKSLDTNPQQDEDKLKTTATTTMTTTTVKATTTTKSEAESKGDLLSPASLDVTTDDILEIQTSLEDERYLTLNSPCLSLTQRRDRDRDLRLESPDSNASFKSAQHIEINEDDVPTPLRVDPSDLADDLMSPSSSSVAATQKQQKEDEEEGEGEGKGEEEQGQEQEEDQEHNIFNGSEVVASGSSLGQETFSALDEMPNLDVDELGQLVEPDYQMSNSRNANSRDTPDDIMKLLES